MSFFIDDKYRDPKTVDLTLVNREIEAGNPHAALLKTVLHVGGFGSGLPLGFKAAITTLEAFLTKHPGDPVCQTALVVCKYYDYQENPTADLQAIKRAKEVLIKKAESGDQYALIYAGVLLGAAISTTSDLGRSEKYLRSASAPVVDTWNDVGLVGDAFARYEYGRRLDNWGHSARTQLTTARSPKDRALLRAKLVTIGDKAMLNTIAAAQDGPLGHVRALHAAGQIYRDAAPGGKYVEKLSRKDLDALAEKYFLDASIQQWMPAKLSLAQFYEDRGQSEKAIELCEQVAVSEEYGDAGKLQLARLYDRAGKYMDALALYTELVPSFWAKGKFEPLIAIIELNYTDRNDPPKRPGFQGEEAVALRACQLARQLKLDKRSFAFVQPIYDDLQSRSWIADPQTGFRRVLATDKLDGEPPTVLPSTNTDSLRILLAEATRPDAKISLDLALAIAESYAKDDDGPAKGTEALHWYKVAANLGSGFAAIQTFKLCCEGEQEDLITALRLARPFLSGQKPKDVSFGDQNYVKGKVRSLLASNTEEVPRVWINDKQGVTRPAAVQDIVVDGPTFETTLDRLTVISRDPSDALKWLDAAASEGSEIAATIAKKIQADHGWNKEEMDPSTSDQPVVVAAPEIEETSAQVDSGEDRSPVNGSVFSEINIHQGVTHTQPQEFVETEDAGGLFSVDQALGMAAQLSLADDEDAAREIYLSVAEYDVEGALEVAERYAGLKAGAVLDLSLALSLYEGVWKVRELLNPDSKDSDALLRLDRVREAILEDAWVDNEGELRRVRHGIYPDMQTVPLEQELYLFPRDKAGFSDLAERQHSFIDVAAEVALRVARGVGCQPDLTEAFRQLSDLLLNREKFPAQDPMSIGPVAENSQRREELQREWDRIAGCLVAHDENDDGREEYVFSNSDPQTKPFEVPQDTKAEFLALLSDGRWRAARALTASI